VRLSVVGGVEEVEEQVDLPVAIHVGGWHVDWLVGRCGVNQGGERECRAGREAPGGALHVARTRVPLAVDDITERPSAEHTSCGMASRRARRAEALGKPAARTGRAKQSCSTANPPPRVPLGPPVPPRAAV
jgi:hypothetical protein